jgi:hypothetical protein
MDRKNRSDPLWSSGPERVRSKYFRALQEISCGNNYPLERPLSKSLAEHAPMYPSRLIQPTTQEPWQIFSGSFSHLLSVNSLFLLCLTQLERKKFPAKKIRKVAPNAGEMS